MPVPNVAGIAFPPFEVLINEPGVSIPEAPSSKGELWARQAGVWLYLPEASLGDALVELCAEAIHAAEKQALSQAELAANAIVSKQL